MNKLALALVMLALLISGCAHSLGYAGGHPGYVRCKGKGSINASGAIAGVGMAGAA